MRMGVVAIYEVGKNDAVEYMSVVLHECVVFSSSFGSLVECYIVSSFFVCVRVSREY